MDKNRLAILTLYTVPEECEGRKEASGVITADDRLIRQNLQLTIADITPEVVKITGVTPLDLMVRRHILYSVNFNDPKSLHDRVQEACVMFDGTHGASTNPLYNDASFRIQDREKLIGYLNGLARLALAKRAL